MRITSLQMLDSLPYNTVMSIDLTQPSKISPIGSELSLFIKSPLKSYQWMSLANFSHYKTYDFRKTIVNHHWVVRSLPVAVPYPSTKLGFEAFKALPQHTVITSILGEQKGKFIKDKKVWRDLYKVNNTVAPYVAYKSCSSLWHIVALPMECQFSQLVKEV